jgi:hypothetical protein
VADLHDIENVLVTTITQFIYPDGTGQPSIANAACKIARGWPVPAQLDSDLAAGKINITVYTLPNEQKTTRYPQDWKTLNIPVSKLNIAVSETTITLSGTPSSPLNVAALVNGKSYVYPVQPGDSLGSISTALAALINADTPASSSGPVIMIPAAYRLKARVGVIGTVIRELKRQKRGFQIICWCPSPSSRDVVAPAIDAGLAAIDYLSLPDGTAGRLLYERSPVVDRSEREGLYRRDLFYSVEYGTTQTQDAAQIVVEVINISGGTHPGVAPIETITI